MITEVCPGGARNAQTSGEKHGANDMLLWTDYTAGS